MIFKRFLIQGLSKLDQNQQEKSFLIDLWRKINKTMRGSLLAENEVIRELHWSDEGVFRSIVRVLDVGEGGLAPRLGVVADNHSDDCRRSLGLEYEEQFLRGKEIKLKLVFKAAIV